jgi:outer membrane lipoprotein-sorting protein
MTSREKHIQFGIRCSEIGRERTAGLLSAAGIALLLLSGVPVPCSAETVSGVTATVVTDPAVTAPASLGTDAVQSIEGHYRDLVDLTAKVVQKNFLKSVEKTQKFEGSLFIKRPGKLRLEAGAIRQDFDVSVPEGGTGGMLDLAPKRPGAAMNKLRLHTDETGRITRMIVYDRSGNMSDVRFSDLKEGVGLDDAQFRFKVPKGTEIIEQ